MSTNIKQLSRDSYVWPHVAVIVFHVILAILIYVAADKGHVGQFDGRDVGKWCAIILGFVSTLALVPIFMKYGYEIPAA